MNQISERVKNEQLIKEVQVQISNYVNYSWSQHSRNSSYVWFIEMTMKRMTFIKRILYNPESDLFSVEFKDVFKFSSNVVNDSCVHFWNKSVIKGMLHCSNCGKYEPEGI